jgi:multiple antibiotic resistance protein
MDFIATALLLFIVLDPLGNIPIYLSQLKVVPEQRRRKVILRELVIAYLVLLFFFFAGSSFMKLLSLDIASVNIAGAVILFLIALRMALPLQEGISDNTKHTVEPLIVPLAVPAMAGPGALSVVLLLREANPDESITLFAAMTVAWLISAAILSSASYLQRALRNEGILAMERLMGMVLVIISIQMLLDALRLIGAIDT